MPSSTALYNSDEDIANVLQNANKDALNALYDKYACILFRLFQKMTGNIIIAEEALESCFVTIWQNRHSYNPSKERLFVWIFQIAINTANTVLEKKQGSEENQISKVSVFNEDSKYTNGKNANLYIEPIIFGHISQQEATEKMGIPIGELRQMLRKELNQSRGI